MQPAQAKLRGWSDAQLADSSMAKPTSEAAKKKAAIKRKIRKCLKAREVGKAGYKLADDLLEEIVSSGDVKAGDEIRLTKSETVKLVDKFAETNRIGVGQGVNRFELKVSRAKDVTDKI